MVEVQMKVVQMMLIRLVVEFKVRVQMAPVLRVVQAIIFLVMVVDGQVVVEVITVVPNKIQAPM